MFEVALDSSWSKDSAWMEASGFPEPVGPEIEKKNRKNVFNKYFLCPPKIVLQELSDNEALLQCYLFVGAKSE